MYDFCMAWIVLNVIGVICVTIATLMRADEDRLPLIPLKVFLVYPIFWEYLNSQQINILGKIIASVILTITFGGSIVGFWIVYAVVLFMWFIAKMFPVIFRKRNNKKSG